MGIISKGLHIVRWNEWYDSKLPLVAACAYYLSLLHPAPWITSFKKVLISLLFYAFFISFGYLINDYCDRDLDQKAGKVREIHSLSNRVVLILLVLLFAFGWIILIPFWNLGFPLFIMVFISYLISIFYSLPPVRLKERGFLGLLGASIAQRFLPILVMGLIWQDLHIEIIIWALIGFLVGMRYILIHQYEDLAADKTTGVQTFASRRLTFIPILMRIIFICELIALFGIIYLVSKRDILFIWIIGFVALYLVGYFFLYRKYIGRPGLLSFVYVPLEAIYSIFLPISLLVLLIKINPLWALLLPIEVIWKYNCICQYMALPARWLFSKFTLSR